MIKKKIKVEKLEHKCMKTDEKVAKVMTIS